MELSNNEGVFLLQCRRTSKEKKRMLSNSKEGSPTMIGQSINCTEMINVSETEQIMNAVEKSNITIQYYTVDFSQEYSYLSTHFFKGVSNPQLIGDYSKPFILPSKEGKGGNTKIMTISSDTLGNLLRGKYDHVIRSFLIVDCRHQYEFNGGHIRGAVNVNYDEKQLWKKLEKYAQEVGPNYLNSPDGRDILILHCEFSSKRAPKMLQSIRSTDRQNNSQNYPKLDFPEMYLLEGGYAKFFESHPDMCVPRSYSKQFNHDDEHWM